VAEPAQSAATNNSRVANRYELHELLGRGGMACVYRATDLATGRVVALKQLITPESAPEHARVAVLFEREFHTLAQLRHPRVIEVYDYGVNAETGPFYTMELLDGGDLRDRAPLPWAEVCGLIFDVCSSLALLHSRRLIHRDISPRNVRCTRDGKAKLIDFGALAPMGVGGATVVGTPAFTPPETLHRLALDARADLFSLGATLYYALTGHMPYPARSFGELLAAWNVKVLPPSARAAEIPVELDHLVLSLINLEPALRPQTAFDVMQRLAAIAKLESRESEAVSRAYLATPMLVGREQLVATFREKLTASRTVKSSGLMFDGASGVGRSRVLDACALEAKTLGFTVLRATASGTLEPFAVARDLTQHLFDALPSRAFDISHPELFVAARPAPAPANDTSLEDAAPSRLELKRFSDPSLDAEQLQRAIAQFIVTASKTQPLMIAVDDVHRIDHASAAMLAALIDKARRGGPFIVLTADRSEVTSASLDVLSRRCGQLTIEPLTRDQTHALFASLFGEVANLPMLAGEVYDVVHGNPRQCLDIAQHLVDKQLVRYAAGTWTLPSHLSEGDLPRSAEDALHERIAFLSPQARFLAECQALAYHQVFTQKDYRALLPEVQANAVDQAISELVVVQAVVSDGPSYTFANRVWTTAFERGLDQAAQQERHRALAALYRETSQIASIHHLFAGGQDEQGLDAIVARHAQRGKNVSHRDVTDENAGKMLWCYPHAVDTAVRLGRSARVVNELRRWCVGSSVAAHGNAYWHSAPSWFKQLEYDSGLELWQQDTNTTDPGERLTRALQTANQRYLDTPEGERVYPVDQALRLLAEYVVFSIANGSRTCDLDLLATLPGVLEPFAVLSPVLDAIWRNATATYCSQCVCQYDRAHELWTAALAKLDAVTGGEMQHIEAIGNAIAYALGMMEAQFGLASAANWAERLDRDPYQQVSALNLRKIVRLEQGDWRGADRLRSQAEVLALKMRIPPMFNSLLQVELAAYGKARDLAGVQLVIDRMQPLAAAYPGWIPQLRHAEARFDLVRGDYAAAKLGFERCLEVTMAGPSTRPKSLTVWVLAQAGLAETLLSMEQAEAARAGASSALKICEELQVGTHSFDLVRVLALCEAKLGDARAAERIEALIETQCKRGVTGLRLGLSYEARAQIAVWQDDEKAFEHYARLTAREYRYAAGSPLGARYERLVNEAQRGGLYATAKLADFETTTTIDSGFTRTDDAPTMVLRIMMGAQTGDDRAKRALRLLAESCRASVGHLYLVSPEGLVLSASHGNVTPPQQLVDQVREYLELERQKSGSITGMATGTLSDESPVSLTLQVEDLSYELLLLMCSVNGAFKVAGVAALARIPGESRMLDAKQSQLLPVLAAHLLQAGDSTGILLES